eukprot:SAG31_NODE_1881_length_7000_cov_9.045646_6_plen_53_part_00
MPAEMNDISKIHDLAAKMLASDDKRKADAGARSRAKAERSRLKRIEVRFPRG